MTSKRMQHNRYSNYYIVFFLLLGMRLLAFFINGQMRLIADEMGMLMVPATLAGRDWSGVASLVKYYGFGYSIFMTPFFALTDNICVIYWLCMSLGAVLLALAGVILYHILVKYLEIPEGKYAVLVAVTTSFIALTDMRYINNEPMIVLVCWALFWLAIVLIKDAQDNQVNYKHMLYMLLLLVYASTVHNRLIVLWVAFALLLVLYRIVYKKELVPLKLFVPIAIFLFKAGNLIISFVTDALWSVESVDGGQVHNTVEQATDKVGSNLFSLFKTDNWNAMLNIVMGNVYVMVFFTCGILCFIFIILYKFIEVHVIKKSDFVDGLQSHDFVNRVIEVGSVLFFLVLVVTIAGLIAVWAPLTAKGQALGYGADTSALKIVVYIRYYSCYVSVLALLFFVFAYHNTKAIKKYIFSASIMFAVIFVYWHTTLMPYIRASSVGLNVFGAYGLLKTEDERMFTKIFLLCGLILLLTFIATCVSYKREKILVPVVLVLVIIGYRFFYNSAYLQSTNEYKAIGGYTLFSELEQEQGIDLPETIYLYLPNTNAVAWQFMLNDYRMVVVEEFPHELESAIMITNRHNSKLHYYDRGYRYVEIDDFSRMWVKGKELQEQMEACGIEFIDFIEVVEEEETETEMIDID